VQGWGWPDYWGPLLFICGTGEGLIQTGDVDGVGMVERFQSVARPYEIKTQNKEVEGY
jgi:hypothetical protein